MFYFLIQNSLFVVDFVNVWQKFIIFINVLVLLPYVSMKKKVISAGIVKFHKKRSHLAFGTCTLIITGTFRYMILVLDIMYERFKAIYLN